MVAMKTLFTFLIGVMALPLAQAHAQDFAATCSGGTQYPAQTVSGTCSAGRCTGSLVPVEVQAAGQCTGGATFNASAMSAEGTLVGRCHNGEFVAIGNAVVLDLKGSCSDGGVFKGDARVRPQWISGVCKENGAFSASVTRWNVPVQGTCGSL
jgi:hypothetical protein